MSGSSLERPDATVIDRGRRGHRGSEARLHVGLRQSTYTSPLPSPDDLDRYAAHVPDAAERLLASGEREQARLSYLGAMVFAISQGYPLAGVGGATFGIAAVIWATRRDPADRGDPHRAAAEEWASREDAALWDTTAGDGL